ncbi:MAG: SDR family oxidoreductase [Thermodesulfobacteriota bacterium]
MKILIAGSSGMLGSECKKVFSKDNEVFCPDREALDITGWDRVIETLDDISADVILNCVGLTDMEACEKDEFAVRKINVEGPRNLAQASARFSCRIVHMSCGEIFDGHKPMPQPYFEDDTPNPLSAYGKSKLESETAVRENSPYYIILRSHWVYGINGKNFIKSLLRWACQKSPEVMKVPNDQYGSPTWGHRLAVQIKSLLANQGRGTYHATADGYCSRFEYARFVLDKLNIKAPMESCSIKDTDDVRHGLVNGLLENRYSRKQGNDAMVHWKADLDQFLEQYAEALIKEAKKS